MKVKYAIQQLSALKPDDEIVIAYWTKEWFIDVLGRDITDTQWLEIADACEDTLEWNGVGDDIQAAAIETLDNEETTQ
jgi:hypothetical protein